MSALCVIGFGRQVRTADQHLSVTMRVGVLITSSSYSANPFHLPGLRYANAHLR